VETPSVDPSENEGAVGFDLVTIDGDTETLATFWMAALALIELEREDEGRWIVLGTPSGVRRIGLQSGTAREGGVHLDLTCSPARFQTEVGRLLGAGASLRRPMRREPFGSIANLTDPEGNPFDLCAYDRPM
jgi:hypothetical protein